MATAQASDLPRGYSQTCRNLAYDEDEGELFAKCRTIDGEYEQTSIDLNRYITNDDGNLEWSREEGNYVDTAGACDITNSTNGLTYLRCDGVRSKNNEIRFATIVLDEHIENIDGQLQYYK